MSNAYDTVLRRRIVQDFVVANHRAPTLMEIEDLTVSARNAAPSLELVGFSGNSISPPNYLTESSASQENINLRAMLDDTDAVNMSLDQSLETLEDQFVGVQNSFSRLLRMLDTLESRCDNLLLLRGDDKIFLGFLEEDFDTQSKVVKESTTVKVESGYVTLDRPGYTPVDASRLKLRASCTGDKKLLAVTSTKPINSLLTNDGTQWQQLVYTQYQEGRVTLVLEIEFDAPTYVGEVRLDVTQVDANARSSVTRLYSTDAQSFSAVDPVEEILYRGENSLFFGQEGVRKIRLLISKQAADSITSDHRYIYLFSIGGLVVYQDKFIAEDSELVLGPYEVLDYKGQPLSFTKARLEACCCVNSSTGVDFYLSKDAETWHSLDWRSETNRVVNFGATSSLETELLEPASALTLAVDSPGALLDPQHECFLNEYIPYNSTSRVQQSQLRIKRYTADNISTVYKAPPGWRLIGSEYTTTIYVSEPNGRWLDLGGTTAKLNGQPVSGRVFLAKGYVEFSTTDLNYRTVDTTLLTAEALKQADALYPYNHKYLIEAYPYTTAFAGERVYPGMEEHFGTLMKYISPEAFAHSEALNVFTVIERDGDWLLKVNVNKSDSSWRQEDFILSWTEANGSGNSLWVKAVLSTSSPNYSPRIDHFAVRMI